MTATRSTIAGPAGDLSVIDVAPAAPTAELPAVFVHGINMAAEQWSRVIDRLAPLRRCIAVDLRGHGRSVMRGPFGVEDYLADALAVIDGLGVARAHFVGASFGCAVAAAASAARPAQVASIALVGGAISTGGVGSLDDRIALLRRVGVRQFFAERLPLATFGPNPDRSVVEEAVEGASSGRPVDLVAEVLLAGFRANNLAVFEAATAPALVVTGEHDLTCPPALGLRLAEVLGTDLVIIPGVGHVPHLEAPSELAALLEAHFGRHAK